MHTHSENSLTPFLSQAHINILFYRKPRDFTNLRKLRRRHVPRDHYPRRISSQSKENNFYPVTSIEDFPSSRPRGKTLPLFLSQTREVSSMVTATKNRTNHFATYVSGGRSFVLTDTFPSLADTCGYSRHNGSLHFTGKWGCRSRGRRNEVACDEKSFRPIVDNIIIPRLETNRLHFDRLPLCSRIYTLDTWPILHKLSFIDGILTKRTE